MHVIDTIIGWILRGVFLGAIALVIFLILVSWAFKKK